MTQRVVKLPPEYALQLKLSGNSVFQLKTPTFQGEVDAEPYEVDKVKGEVLTINGRRIAVMPKKIAFPEGIDALLVAPEAKFPAAESSSPGSWAKKSGQDQPGTSTLLQRRQRALESWKGQFSFIEESNSGSEVIPGLRPPQIGAVHASIAHWKMSTEPATIVMPTGTGKTETMVALMVHQRPDRLLVVVPSDALRTQISAKFIRLGLLKDFGVCGPDAEYPIVGVLNHRPKSLAELKSFVESCNVVVSTMALVGRFQDEEQKLLSTLCSHLFIDEAHHIKAETWSRLRDHFAGRSATQSTWRNGFTSGEG